MNKGLLEILYGDMHLEIFMILFTITWNLQQNKRV